MNIFLFITAVIIFYLGIACLYYKKDIIELCIHALSAFFFVYILVSGILFYLDQFSIQKALLLTMAVGLILDLVLVMRKRPTFSFQCRDSVPALIIFLAIIPLLVTRFGVYGMGQDQGVYQIKAMALIYGYNSNTYSFDEYDKLTTQEERTDFADQVTQLTGFYLTDLSAEDIEAGANPTSGVFHGISTYPALLALWGSMFGAKNMMGIQAIFFLISIFMITLILRNMGTKKPLRVLASVVFACSPVLLWTAKTSLVETFLTVIVLSFLYLLTDRENNKYAWMACIPVIVFASYHVTIYVMLPMFVLIFVAFFFASKSRQYLIAAMLSVAGYYFGYQMMIATDPAYTYGNYDRLYRFGINSGNLTQFITIVVVATLVILLLMVFIPFPKMHQMKERTWKMMVRLLVLACIAACILVSIKSVYPLNYTTIYAFSVSSGIVILPLILVVIFIKPGLIHRNSQTVLLSSSLLYFVFIYSIVFKREVLYYYYYARYIVPYVSIIILLGVYLLGELIDKRKTVAIVSLVSGIVIVLIMMPYNAVIATQQDETNVSWEILEQIQTRVESTGEDTSAIIVDPDLLLTMMLPVKITTGADCYPQSGSLDQQIADLQEQYQTVYYITQDLFVQTTQQIHSIYTSQNKQSLDYSNPDFMVNSGTILPFSKRFEVTIQNITMYECR